MCNFIHYLDDEIPINLLHKRVVISSFHFYKYYYIRAYSRVWVLVQETRGPKHPSLDLTSSGPKIGPKLEVWFLPLDIIFLGFGTDKIWHKNDVT